MTVNSEFISISFPYHWALILVPPFSLAQLVLRLGKVFLKLVNGDFQVYFFCPLGQA